MRIEVLGESTPRTEQLVQNVLSAVRKMGTRDLVIRVRNSDEIAARGIWKTPALAVDGSVEAIDAVPETESLVTLFTSIHARTQQTH